MDNNELGKRLDKASFAQKVNQTYSNMTAEEKQNSQKRIAKRLSQITNSDNEKKLLKKKKMKAIFNKSLFSSPLKQLVLLKDYTAPENSKHPEYYQYFQDITDEFANSIINDESAYNLLYTGRPGTGKTYLSISLLGQLLVNNKSVLFLNTSKLKQLAFQFYDDTAKAKLNTIKQYAADADLLILDDMGTETSNRTGQMNQAAETMQQLIYDIADARTDKFTLVTTNLSSDEMQAIYNEKIISRLFPKNPERIVNFNAADDLRGRR